MENERLKGKNEVGYRLESQAQEHYFLVAAQPKKLVSRRLGPIHIKRLARFKQPVDQVYQLVHSRRNDGFRCHALGVHTLRHVLDLRIKAHCPALHVPRLAQVCVAALAHKGSTFDTGA